MKDEIKINVPDNYDMEADAQREISRMRRNSNSASEASAKPVYKYETLDRYAGYGILGLSAFLILSFLYLVIKSWPI
jgi:hypothetical protein